MGMKNPRIDGTRLRKGGNKDRKKISNVGKKCNSDVRKCNSKDRTNVKSFKVVGMNVRKTDRKTKMLGKKDGRVIEKSFKVVGMNVRKTDREIDKTAEKTDEVVRSLVKIKVRSGVKAEDSKGWTGNGEARIEGNKGWTGNEGVRIALIRVVMISVEEAAGNPSTFIAGC